MRISVVAAAREDDRPPTEALDVAVSADRYGYAEVWLGEGPTWDAFALAVAVGLATENVALTLGPIPMSVRDPATSASPRCAWRGRHSARSTWSRRSRPGWRRLSVRFE